MGLFSFKKNSSSRTAIPADILADVSVNGEKRVDAPTLLTESSGGNGGAVSTSPFLSSKGQATVSEPPAGLPVESEQDSRTVSVPEAALAPKSFQFSDQTPAPNGIRFKEPGTPLPSQASVPVTTSSSQPDFSQITQDKALSGKQKEHLAPLSLTPSNTPPIKKPFLSVANIVSVLVFILILGLISGGSWYYLNTRSTEEELVPEASIGELLPGEETGVPGELTADSILLDQPNYLTLNIETITLPEIKALLETEAKKMSTENVTVPVEYLVVDTNNNPVAFSRFALLIGADTPKDLIEASLEPFSLYLFLDQGSVRLALAVALRAETPATFPSNKNALPESMRKFLYPEEYEGFALNTLQFSQTSYQNNTIFYANIEESRNYSFDMSMQEGILTFANSKNTLRAVIDKRLLTPTE